MLQTVDAFHQLRTAYCDRLISALRCKKTKGDKIRVNFPGNIGLKVMKQKYAVYKWFFDRIAKCGASESKKLRMYKQLLLFWSFDRLYVELFSMVRRSSHSEDQLKQVIKIRLRLLGLIDYATREHVGYTSPYVLRLAFETLVVLICYARNSMKEKKTTVGLGIALNNTSTMEHFLKMLQTNLRRHNNHKEGYAKRAMYCLFFGWCMALVHGVRSISSCLSDLGSGGIALWTQEDQTNWSFKKLPAAVQKMAKDINAHRAGKKIPQYLSNISCTQKQRAAIKAAAEAAAAKKSKKNSKRSKRSNAAAIKAAAEQEEENEEEYINVYKSHEEQDTIEQDSVIDKHLRMQQERDAAERRDEMAYIPGFCQY